MSESSTAVHLTRDSAPAWPRLLAPLLLLELGLVVGYLFTRTGVLGEQMGLWFDLDREQSVGAWFSSAQLLAIAAVLALTPLPAVAPGAPSRWFMRLLSAAFVFLSMDESIGIHEAVSMFLRQRAPGLILGWMPVYLVGGALALALAGPQLLRLWRGHPVTSTMFAVGAAIFAAGGLMLELVGFALNSSVLPLQIVLEEAAEMVGASIMLCAVLDFRARMTRPRSFEWG